MKYPLLEYELKMNLVAALFKADTQSTVQNARLTFQDLHHPTPDIFYSL